MFVKTLMEIAFLTFFTENTYFPLFFFFKCENLYLGWITFLKEKGFFPFFFSLQEKVEIFTWKMLEINLN